jgi:hypothetical protein
MSRNIFYLHTEKEITSSLKSNSLEVIDITKLGYGRKARRDDGIWMAIEAEKS